jgi:hypothetical protein
MADIPNSSLREGEVGGSDSLPTTGIVDSTARQPEIFDYSQTNQFKIYLPIFPTVEWFVVQANIPGVTLGQASQYTPFVDIAVVGDKLEYDNFNMTFIVDEKLHNYQELLKWTYNIGFPFARTQFNASKRPDNMNRGGHQTVRQIQTSMTEGNSNTFRDVNDRNLYTDIMLTILSSKNNPVVNVHIYEAFPVSLSSIDYNTQETDTGYATCTVEFAFTWFEVKPSKA